MAEIKSMKSEMEIISTETIKPSSPTPSDLQTYTLSVLAQTFPAVYFTSLIVYNNSSPKSDIDINHLKLSLSESLSRFYTFAGRCDDESTVSCNDEGIPFSSTRVNCTLSDALNPSNEFGSLSKLLPSVDLISPRPRPVSELVPLAFQINVFACGGVVIGCYKLHKLMDASSFGTFFQYWAGVASRQARQDLVEPDFVAGVSAFPPSPKVDRYTITGFDAAAFGLACPVKVVAKTFKFSSLALAQLKAKAASDMLPNPTRFEALAGFVWEQAFAAACEAGTASPSSPTLLSMAANIRSKTNPPLSQGSIGNLVVNVIAQTEKLAGLSDLAIEIHESVSSQLRAKIKDIKGEAGADVVIAYRKKLVQDYIIECKPNLYKLSSWCNLGLKEANFGFGKPERIIPLYGELNQFYRNFISFTDCLNPTDDGNGDMGIEVRLTLDENEMQILESNPVFLTLGIPVLQSEPGAELAGSMG